MKIIGQHITIKQLFFLMLYYGCFRHFPKSCFPFLKIGSFSKKMRYMCCKHIFCYCGKNVNVERKAYFGLGLHVSIGDYSGLGINSVVPQDIQIGKYVMMAPNCYILSNNHTFDDRTKPMMFQGLSVKKQTVIGDDVWIGRDVLMTPGRTVLNGCIIGAGTVLTKNFSEYSIVGGNPSRLIRLRSISK